MPYTCPLCGAQSNRKGAPFHTPEAVFGHIDAKRDPPHDDRSGRDFRAEITGVVPLSSGSDNDPGSIPGPPDAGPSEDSDEQPRPSGTDSADPPVLDDFESVEAFLEASDEYYEEKTDTSKEDDLDWLFDDTQ